MIEKVRNYIELHHMIDRGDRIVIGVSGGADSIALLFILHELATEYGAEVFVVHINHGIREEAQADAEYVKHICDTLSVSFTLFEENIPLLAQQQKMTEEEMGRIYRYNCFFEVMKRIQGRKLAVAHHMDDQAETCLFHLIRGSNMSGMTGMQPVSDAWEGMEGKIIRPLLACRKEELVDWLQRRNVTWKEDCTNADNIYARNSIRNQVLPVLEKMNGKAVRHIAEYAENMAEYHAFFKKMVANYIKEHVLTECDEETDRIIACKLHREELLRQEKVLAKGILYEMLCMVCGRKKDIANVHVEAVYDLVTHQSGRRISLPYRMEAVVSYENLQIRKCLHREEGADMEIRIALQDMLEQYSLQRSINLPDGKELEMRLYLREQCSEEDWAKVVNEVEKSKNNYTKFFECDTIKDALCIRTTRAEDYFVMNREGSTKKVSRYFIDRKIPQEQRKSMLVLAIQNRVLWIVGERRCEEYRVDTNSKIVLKVMYKGEAYGTSD